MKPGDDQDEWQAPGAVMEHDGTVTGQADAPAPEPRPAPQRELEAPLELAERQPEAPLEWAERHPLAAPASTPEEGPGPLPLAKPRLRVGLVGVVAVVWLLGGAAAFLVLRHRGKAVSLEPETPGVSLPVFPPSPEVPHTVDFAAGAAAGIPGTAALTIESVPSGATVYLEGKQVGRTPYLGSNDVAPGLALRVRLSFPGYRTWARNFPGGKDQTLKITLVRAK